MLSAKPIALPVVIASAALALVTFLACSALSVPHPLEISFIALGVNSVVLALLAASCLRAGRDMNLPYRHLIDSSKDAVVIVHPTTCRILYVNAVLADHLGLSGRESRSLTLHEVLHTNGESALQINTRIQASQFIVLKMRTRMLESRTIDVEVRFRPVIQNGKTLWAYTARDLSEQMQSERQLLDNQSRLARLANHDQLTSLPNRHYISSFLPDAIASAKAAGGMLGVVFLDLDRFKLINDTQGHETGDKLLQVVAQRLRECVRQVDVVVRMGGDEFVIVLVNVKSHDEVERSAKRVIESLQRPIVIEKRQIQTSASIGISIYPRDGADLTSLLKHSDTAMYQAKDRGRNNVQVFTPIMNRKLKQRVTVEAMLREALTQGQLDVHYQPFIDLRTRQVVGLEALIRWKHPTRGMIPADAFIPIAEETGLIIPLGDFVLERAFQDIAQWRAAGARLVPVSLNVAPAQLLRGDFQVAIARGLAQYSLTPQCLQIEMTERAIFDIRAPQPGEKQVDSIAGLRDLGIKIAIDDFGTGYSSLAYLKNWRVDTLKIDRSFIRDLASDSSDYAIVSAIIAMAKHLRIEVIAEGIEGYQQADILRNLGCHQGQGYLYARPMSAKGCLVALNQQLSQFGYDKDDSLPAMALGE